MSGESVQVEGVGFLRGGVLVERALALLARGPAPTAAVAEEVLKLRGNPRAAAAAVFALLGADPRVRVDPAGVWSLAEAKEPVPLRTLRQQEWIVVDVETTGGSPARGHRVMEIAAVRVAGGEVRQSFSSLVDPGRSIPRTITAITGITGAMVAGAPRFEQVATRFATAFRGRVFVGHNAGFDWRFVSAEMERCTGRVLVGRQLCTLQLARRLLPQLPSRSLGALASYFGVRMATHHRALDDARATAELLLHFLAWLEDRGVEDWIALQSYLSRRARRPRRSALPRSMSSA